MHYRFSPWNRLSLAVFSITALLMPVAMPAALAQSPFREMRQNRWSFWDNSRNNEPPVPSTPGGGRPGNRLGNGVCLLAPVQLPGVTTLWSDRPLFLWRGPVSRIEIANSEGQVIWDKTDWESPAENVYLQRYDGPALQPSVQYEWRIYQSPDEDTVGSNSRSVQGTATNDMQVAPAFIIPIQVLTRAERQQIAGELGALDVILDAEQVPVDQRSLNYVSFFAEKQLWADALRVAFTASPNAALQRYQEAVLETCDRS
ncbi:hypothetical protein [Leptolyngbya sp. FACHB-16]|nr:hypothetical protein [Leptolyngbya sp. FACHB-16]MBD2158404.1 hypothetical protein [Leptolyngbya sp. FACHB-16]